MKTSLLHLKRAAVLASLFVSTTWSNAATLFENFDAPSVQSNTNSNVDITYNSCIWFTNGKTTATEDDRINGLYSMRMRGLSNLNVIYMKFDKAGAGTLSFKYGSYNNHRNGEFNIQKSIDGGLNWVTIGTPVVVPAWSGTFLTYSLPINYNGAIRFKLMVTCRTPNNPNEQFNIDDWMITDYGTEQVAMPTSSVPTGVYETPQAVTLTSTTAGATIYYTTDGTAPSTASSVYSTPLNITTTTKIRTLAVAAGKVDSREEVVLISFPESVPTLAELTTKMAASGTNLTYFKYTGEAVVSYAYSTSITSGYGTTVTNYLYMQDQTAGISMKDNGKNLSTNYNTGDKVTGIIGQIFNVNNTAQVYPYSNFTVLSSNNILTPVLITLADVGSKPNQLVQLNNVFFDGADGIKTFSAFNSYYLNETTFSNFPMRFPSNMTVVPDYNGTIIPMTARNAVGILSKIETGVFTNTSLFVRSAADLDAAPLAIEQTRMGVLSVSGNSVLFETAASELIKVYSINGQLIRSFVSSVGKNRLTLNKGFYLIRIGTKTSKVVL